MNSPLPVFKFRSVPIKLSWVWDHSLCRYTLIVYCWCWCCRHSICLWCCWFSASVWHIVFSNPQWSKYFFQHFNSVYALSCYFSCSVFLHCTSLARWAWWCFTKYYDLRLGSGCNLGKDLRKNRDGVQLVKHKEYRVVSMLYIHIVYETSVWSTWGKWVIEHEDKARTVYLLHEVLTELHMVQPIMPSLSFAHIHAASRRCWS